VEILFDTIFIGMSKFIPKRELFRFLLFGISCCCRHIRREIGQENLEFICGNIIKCDFHWNEILNVNNFVFFS
jgi:hypothetical protein